MEQNYTTLSDDRLEQLEKQTLRVVVQALQEYSREARVIFENTEAPTPNEVIVLAEDLTQYALEVAEIYAINKRFAGFIDYKKVRWLPTPFGIFPQAFLVDAKASTESNRETLQQSQLPMDADFMSHGKHHRLQAGVPPHMEVEATSGGVVLAVTTTIFVHFYYEDLNSESPPYRRLRSIYILGIPHQRLKSRYNPDPHSTFFGQGKHSPRRGEAARIRVYFSRLRRMCPWRLQELRYIEEESYSVPTWRDSGPDGKETHLQFAFLGR